MEITYKNLNAELNLIGPDGGIQFEKDHQAARAYFLEHVNPRTRFFHSLEEKVDYLLENNYWDHSTVERFPFDKFKALFKRAYSRKFRFQTFMGAFKFFSQYALTEQNDDGGICYLERLEDRVVMTAIDLSGGDYGLAEELVDIIIGGYFQPATPTFLNAGRARGGERVSCFLIRMEDNLESIARAYASGMQLSKRGGGVGILLTNMREQGAPLKGVPGVGRGVVPIMKNLEDQFSHIDQLGQRQGAGAVYLNAHHPDIMRFLDTKRENADEKIRIKTLSLGVVIPDITFELAKHNQDMYLFSPYDVERVEGIPMSDLSVTENYHRWVEDARITKTKVNARKFFQTLSEVQFESGYPYVLFEDNANRQHPMKHAGRINMSNLCSEIAQLNTLSTLNEDLSYQTVGSDISCNLGSLNVKRMLDLPRDRFLDVVIAATRALDQVSRTTHIGSVPSVAAGNERSRAIGLGQMNLHGALAHHRIHYGSEEALALWDRYMALVTYGAMLASTQIAKLYGPHEYFEGSEYATGEWFKRVPYAWLEESNLMGCSNENALSFAQLSTGTDLHAPTRTEWEQLEIEVYKHGMGNAYLQTIPPTGSISYINNSTSSIHPIVSKVEIRKEGKLGRVYYPAPHMTNENLEYYRDAYEIGPEPIIDTYAISQRWIDQSQSLTLFFTDEASTRNLDRARIYAWRKGIKSLYYIRLRQMALSGTEAEGCVSCAL